MRQIVMDFEPGRIGLGPPTAAEYAAYDGLHCSSLWRELDDVWICPGCGRTKFQLLRWTRINFPAGKSYFGWCAGLHHHHDHWLTPPRFAEQVICDCCNWVDVFVKRRFPKMPRDFSFAPAEIRSIIVARPHLTHKIRYSDAWCVFQQVLTGFRWPAGSIG
jgi:hypothetical protein